MKLKQVIIYEAPDGYDHLDDLESQLLKATPEEFVQILDSIGEKFKIEEDMDFPSGMTQGLVQNTLYGALIDKLKNLGVNPFLDYFIDTALIFKDGKWHKFYQYDSNANIIHF